MFKGTKIKHKVCSKAKGGCWGVVPEVAKGYWRTLNSMLKLGFVLWVLGIITLRKMNSHQVYMLNNS